MIYGNIKSLTKLPDALLIVEKDIVNSLCMINLCIRFLCVSDEVQSSLRPTKSKIRVFKDWIVLHYSSINFVTMINILHSIDIRFLFILFCFAISMITEPLAARGQTKSLMIQLSKWPGDSKSFVDTMN